MVVVVRTALLPVVIVVVLAAVPSVAVVVVRLAMVDHCHLGDRREAAGVAQPYWKANSTPLQGQKRFWRGEVGTVCTGLLLVEVVRGRIEW